MVERFADKSMLDLVNQNYDASVYMTEFNFEFIYPLELTPDRFTALMKIPAGEVVQTSSIHHTLIERSNNSIDDRSHHTEISFNTCQSIEAFVLEGECSVEGNSHKQGSYIRIPNLKEKALASVTDCIVFIKLNQFLHGDTGVRDIDTTTPDKWLPGPVDGIEIRPLHVFDTESIMLLRWQHAAEFRPKLNPRGEEILVINGLLQNRDHLYRQFSWIRNPIEDWRKWHGNTGTLVYYKSGHFPDDPARQTST